MPVIAARLKETRVQKGLTQKELADLAGLTKNTVYNVERGTNASITTVKRLADSLEVSCEFLLSDDGEIGDDAISAGPFGFRSRLRKRLQLSSEAFAKDQEDVRAAAREMVAGFSKNYEESTDSQGWKDFQLAYKALPEFADLIVESYVRAWQQSEASFLFAVENGERVGLSSNWPISDQAYELFREGKLAFFDFTADMIEFGSQNILVNSAFEYPNKKKPFLEVTDSVFHLILYQMGTQTQDAWDDSFRMVCFTGTPLNQQRAIANGFKPLGVSMPKVPFPLFEFTAHSDSDDTESTLARRMLRGIAGAFVPTKLKRNALRAAVSAYQYAFRTTGNRPSEKAG